MRGFIPFPEAAESAPQDHRRRLCPEEKYALKIDSRVEPPMFKVSDTHYAATWLLHPKAPKVELPGELKARIDRMMKEGEHYDKTGKQ